MIQYVEEYARYLFTMLERGGYEVYLHLYTKTAILDSDHFCIQITDNDGSDILLELLEVYEKRQGHGSFILRRMRYVSHKMKLKIYLQATPLCNMKLKHLHKFYEENLFVRLNTGKISQSDTFYYWPGLLFENE